MLLCRPNKLWSWRLKNSTSATRNHWWLWTHKHSRINSYMIFTNEQTEPTMQSISWKFTLHMKEITFIVRLMSTKSKSKSKKWGKLPSISIGHRPSKRNQAQGKISKLSSSPWETNSITMEGKFKQSIQILRKKERPPSLHRLRI